MIGQPSTLWPSGSGTAYGLGRWCGLRLGLVRRRPPAGLVLFSGRSGRRRVHAEASMGDLYGVLGLPRDASGDAIKAAYRALARELHPDANVANDIKAGAAGSEDRAQRLREVNQAYETLGDPQARAAYDRDLARQRADTRRRYSIFAASTLATFALTMTAVSFAVRWHLEAAASRTAPAPAPPREVSREVPNGPGEAAAHRGQGAMWATYRNATFDFALRYPADVFVLDSGQSTGTVQTFVSRDGRAVLRILAARNTAGLTLSD